MDCCCEQWAAVVACGALKCPLWKYRLGKSPFSKKLAGSVLLNATEMEKMRGLPHEEFLKWHKTQKRQAKTKEGGILDTETQSQPV